MARYFAGNTLAAFFRTNSAIVETTSSGKFDSTFVPSAITLPLYTDYAETYAFSATGTVWFHFEFYTPGNQSTVSPIIYGLNGVNSVFRLTLDVSTAQFQYWNGSAWTNTGTTFALSTAVLYRFDIKVALNSGFELYTGGTLRTSGSGWSGGATTVTSARFSTPSTNSTSYVSQVMVADFDTRDSRYYQISADGNSASNNGGTGTYTDINETVLDETTAEVVSVAGNKMGQTWANITLPSGYIVGAVCMGARGRIAGTITDGKLGIRSGGSNYSSSGKAYTTGYEPRGRIDETDPATSANWTQSGVNAVETYIEAV